jgi:DNA-binding NarL/FixJ family response regulator
MVTLILTGRSEKTGLQLLPSARDHHPMSGAAPEKPIRILLAGGQRPLVKALEARLEGSPRFEVVGVAFDAEEAARQADKLSPDVVLLDAAPDGLDVVDAARRLSQEEQEAKVLVLTDEDTELDSVEAHRAGAVAFLRRPPSPDELLETLELVTALVVDTAQARSGS